MHFQILVVDDAPQIRRVLQAALVARGHAVLTASSGEEALLSVRDHGCDLIVLDLGLPGMGGVEVCRSVRQVSPIPIIVLSVRDGEVDKVRALDAGADDYLTKPFALNELLARIRSVMRRSAAIEPPALLRLGALTVDMNRRTIAGGAAEARLTPKEFELLSYFASHAGRVLTHRALLQSVWGSDYGDQTEYLRVFVNQLRRKLEPDPAHPRFLLTEPWVGYRFDPADAGSTSES